MSWQQHSASISSYLGSKLSQTFPINKRESVYRVIWHKLIFLEVNDLHQQQRAYPLIFMTSSRLHVLIMTDFMTKTSHVLCSVPFPADQDAAVRHENPDAFHPPSRLIPDGGHYRTAPAGTRTLAGVGHDKRLPLDVTEEKQRSA